MRADPNWVRNALEHPNVQQVRQHLEIEKKPLHDHTIMANVIARGKISDGAFRLYFLLLSHCWQSEDGKHWRRYCWPTQRTLAWKMDKSSRQIRRFERELFSVGLIGVVSTRQNGHRRNIYILFEWDWDSWEQKYATPNEVPDDFEVDEIPPDTYVPREIGHGTNLAAD